MIRLRRSAPMLISFGMLLFGLALPAITQGSVLTRAEMESFVYTVVGVAGASIFGSFWVLLTYLNSRTERNVEKIVEGVTQNVDRLVAQMSDHHADPLAHPAGSANRINPIMERLDKIEDKISANHDVLVKLHAEHAVIREREDEVCQLFRARARQKRQEDPEDLDVQELRG